MRHLLSILALLIVLPGPVHAWNKQEIQLMPPYCAGRYARIDNTAEYKRWETRYGPDFLHTHHLCDGIGSLNRYYKARNAMEKRGILNEAMGGLNYMIQHAQPTFKLMPDVYLYRSRVFHLMEKPGEAIADIRKSIELDPKQPQAYSLAAEYLGRLNQRGEALKLVSEGLRHLPGNKGMQALYATLGGKPPYPEPYALEERHEEAAAANLGQPDTGARPPRLAVFDLGHNVGAARRQSPIVNAGAYILLEVKEEAAAPDNKVRFRLVSRISQPVARISQVGIDTGSFSGLFANIEVDDPLLGKYYPLRTTGGTYTHAYWPNFTPDFLAQFTIDPKVGKMYDPHALPPGGSLTLVATLGPGRRFEDVVEAMKLGLQRADGLRFGVIAIHLMGVRPDPTKTIMDDAGFLTGHLRQLSGLDEEPATAAPAQDDNKSAARPGGQGDTAETLPSRSAVGVPANRNCRFCPDATPK